MITNNELEAIKLSPTKKDFYQIWNELLEVSRKISERWDPTSTNENDPGIVLLKVLTATADKLNYNIDKNILEAFMPSAAQEESMRKLCDMLGYSMKYYQSATTTVSIAYPIEKFNEISNTNPDAANIIIPAFSVVTSLEKDIAYFTLTDCILTKNMPAATVLCMEGQRVECETENDNMVTLAQLDDDFRYYLPETQIAENGIFIYNVDVQKGQTEPWEKVTNLNTQPAGSNIFKFGFDSRLGLPYIKFPDDVGNLIKDGFKIFYTRTHGINGNISANTLISLEKPNSATIGMSSVSWDDLNMKDFKVANQSATGNGKNKETINQAYNNYKKTIGTFDTLITCRDYMNKIYSLLNDEDIPLVSNIIVSDIRDDINRAYTLCEFNEFGVCYTDKSFKSLDSNTDLIGHFNLMLYPFKTVLGLGTEKEYENSFKYEGINKAEIEARLAKTKTISHIFTLPAANEIVCIKNYLKLNARITTTNKINAAEEKDILNNIYSAIYRTFNSRELDFGEEIPFDSILDCLKNADSRIKNVSLEEPVLYTKFACANGEEYDVASMATNNFTKQLYNKLVLKNILAGKIALFNYDTNFKPSLAERVYDYKYGLLTLGTLPPYETIYPTEDNKLVKIESEFHVQADGSKQLSDITLTANEVIQFRAPNFKTTITYPAYVNYYLSLTNTGDDSSKAAHAATFTTLTNFMTGNDGSGVDRWGATLDVADTETMAGYYNNSLSLEDKEKILRQTNNITSPSAFQALQSQYGNGIYYAQTNRETPIHVTSYQNTGWYYYFILEDSTYQIWVNYLQQLYNTARVASTKVYAPLNGFYRQLSGSGYAIGNLVDSSGNKYSKLSKYYNPQIAGQTVFDTYYVQKTNAAQIDPTPVGEYYDYTNSCTIDGLGCNAYLAHLPAGMEYQLKNDEVLYINYTKAASATGTETASSQNTIINKIYTAPTIVKPNFDLYDSRLKNMDGTSFSKTKGFNFGANAGIEGMYGLGATEQIEIREPVEVELGKTEATNIFVYWQLQKDKNALEGETLTFFEEGATKYTLREGEYFYYTDLNKMDMAYYGSGTEIIRSTTDLELTKIASNDISAEDVLIKGLNAIPWVKLYVTETNYLTAKEYQYTTLTEGDTLIFCDISDANNTAITNSWIPCKSAEYRYKGEENDPQATPHKLADIAVTGATWEVRSRLDFNVGPNKIQLLQADAHKYNSSGDQITYDAFTVTEESNSTGESTSRKLMPRRPAALTAAAPIPIAVKTNYLVQAATDIIDTHVIKTNNDGTQEHLDDFKLKLFENVDVAIYANNQVEKIIPLNNFSSNYTKVSFDELKPEGNVNKSIKFNINFIEDTQYGILMLYYVTNNTEIQSNSACLEATVSDSFKLFNRAQWWGETGTATPDPAPLRPGLNIIQITKPTTLILLPAPTGETVDTSSAIIFGNLDVVKVNDNDQGLNLDQLNYQKITSGTIAEQLLQDIRNVDTNYEFFTNCPIINSQAIEINSLLTGDEAETLSTPRIWYDYNNVNNKFVISEIDPEAIKTGITITKSSKL